MTTKLQSTSSQRYLFRLAFDQLVAIEENSGPYDSHYEMLKSMVESWDRRLNLVPPPPAPGPTRGIQTATSREIHKRGLDLPLFEWAGERALEARIQAELEKDAVKAAKKAAKKKAPQITPDRQKPQRCRQIPKKATKPPQSAERTTKQRPGPKPKVYIAPESKVCSKCAVEKPIDSFSLSNNRHRSDCKSCNSAARQARRRRAGE